MAGVWEIAHRLPPLGTGSLPALYTGHKHHQMHTVGTYVPVCNVCITAMLYRDFRRRTYKNRSILTILEPP